MVQDAEENAESDRKQLELIELRNTAEGFLNEGRTDFEKYGSGLTEEERTKFTTARDELEASVRSDDTEDIRARTMTYMQALSPITGLKYKAENPETESKDNANPNEPVDAEVKEVKPGV